MGKIWKNCEFLIWSTRLTYCVVTCNILSWGFLHIFSIVANIRTNILSTQSGQKVSLGLLGELQTFSWPIRKINNFRNIFENQHTLYLWYILPNFDDVDQEIDFRGSHVPYMSPSHVKHVFLHIKPLKFTPKMTSMPMFYPVVSIEWTIEWTQPHTIWVKLDKISSLYLKSQSLGQELTL